MATYDWPASESDEPADEDWGKATKLRTVRSVGERPRGAPSVSPTPAGHLLLDRAARIGDILASTRADLATLAAEHAVLRVGIFQSASAQLLNPAGQLFGDDQGDQERRRDKRRPAQNHSRRQKILELARPFSQRG